MEMCKPCGITYHNRLTTQGEVPKIEPKPLEETSTKTEELPSKASEEVRTGKTLTDLSCGKEIISITQVGDQVIVMYADCSYSTVHKDKVNLDSFIGDKLLCMAHAIKVIDERLQEVEAREDKDTIYDDSALTARVKALEDKPDMDTIYDDTEIRNELNIIKNSIPDISNLATKDEVKTGLNSKVNVNDLIVVENLEGTSDLFKAIKL